MGLNLIKGRFFIKGYSPDGDSIRFRADNKTHWSLLGPGPLVINDKDDVQLRFEGIDAMETHYSQGGQEKHQPLVPSRQARDEVLGQIGFNNIVWSANQGEVTSVGNDGQPGYIFARKKDAHGRPISLVYVGNAPEADGTDVFVDIPRLRQSLNHHLLANGLAYPFFFTQSGLFTDMRNEMIAVVTAARAGGVGLYAQDKTVSGVNITSTVVITDQEPLFPRLFRRLADFLEGNPVNLSGFKAFLEMQDTRVVVLSPANETGFDNLVDVLGSVVKLLQPPENLLFLE